MSITRNTDWKTLHFVADNGVGDPMYDQGATVHIYNADNNLIVSQAISLGGTYDWSPNLTGGDVLFHAYIDYFGYNPPPPGEMSEVPVTSLDAADYVLDFNPPGANYFFFTGSNPTYIVNGSFTDSASGVSGGTYRLYDVTGGNALLAELSFAGAAKQWDVSQYIAPGRTYRATWTVTDNGGLSATGSSDLTTPNIPGKVTNVRLSTNSDGSTQIRWDAPTSGGPVTYYMLYAWNKNQTSQIYHYGDTEGALSVNLGVIPLDVVIAWSIDTENSAGTNTVSGESNRPGVPQNVRVTGRVAKTAANGSMTIAWNDPANIATAPVNAWDVTIAKASDGTVLATTTAASAARSATLSAAGLTNDLAVTVKVVAKDVNGLVSAPASITDTTYRSPGAVNGLAVANVSSTSFKATWAAPTVGDATSYTYDVVLKNLDTNAQSSFSTANLYYDFTGLGTWTNYQVTVTPKDNYNLLGPASSVSTKTGRPAPQITVSDVTYTSMMVDWPLDAGIREYRVTVERQLDETTSDNPTIDIGEGYNSWTQLIDTPLGVETDGSTPKSNVSLKGLDSSGYNYLITVKAVYTDNTTATATVLTSTPAYIYSSPPKNVRTTAIDYTAIAIAWDPADAGSYPIAYYRLTVQERPTNNVMAGNVLVNVNLGNVTSYTIDTPIMRPGTRYGIFLTAVDTYGAGISAPTLYAVTTADTTAPEAPSNLKVQFRDKDSATVTWNPIAATHPDPGESGFSRFTLSFTPQNPQHPTVSLDNVGITGTYTVPGLVVGDTYTVLLSSVDVAGNKSSVSAVYTHASEFLKRAFPRYDISKRVFPRMRKRAFPKD